MAMNWAIATFLRLLPASRAAILATRQRVKANSSHIIAAIGEPVASSAAVRAESLCSRALKHRRCSLACAVKEKGSRPAARTK